VDGVVDGGAHGGARGEDAIEVGTDPPSTSGGWRLRARLVGRLG